MLISTGIVQFSACLTSLREDMTKLYSGVDVAALFGPVTVTQPRVPIRDMDKEEKAVCLKEIRVTKSEGHQTIVFSGSDNWPVGSRSGSGKLVSSPGAPTGAEFSHIKRS